MSADCILHQEHNAPSLTYQIPQSSGLLMLAAFSEHYMGVLGSKWSFDQLVGGCVRLYSSVVLNNRLCFSFCFHSSQF